jgi:hypothetical protein
MAMQGRLSNAEIVIIAAGGAALVFSFLPWLDYPGDFGGGSRSAWGSGLLPTYTWVAILGAAMAIVITLERLAGVQLPATVLGFTWNQVHIVLALFTALIAVSFLVTDKSGLDLGIGFILSLVASAGLVAGAFMLQRERAGGTRPATPGGGLPPPGAPPPPPPPV